LNVIEPASTVIDTECHRGWEMYSHISCILGSGQCPI